MATSEEIKLIIEANTTRAVKQLDKLNKTVGKTTKGLKTQEKQVKSSHKGWATFGAILGTVVVAGFAKVISLASDLEEETDKLNVVFSDFTEEAAESIQNLTENYGQSTAGATRMLAATGDLLTGFGFAQDKALDLSDQVAKLAVDLTSFSNFTGGAEEASKRLTAAMLGETEGVKVLGIAIKQKEIKQRALAQGMELVNGTVNAQQKAFLVLQIAQEQSKNAADNYLKTQNSFANVTRRLQNTLKDFGAKLGKEFLPELAKIGILFIEVSKDGGVLFSALKAIMGAIVAAGKGLANLIGIFQLGVALTNADKQVKSNKELNEVINRRLGIIKKVFSAQKQGNESIAQTVTRLAKSGNKRAKVALMQMDNLRKSSRDGFESANKDLSKVTGTIAALENLNSVTNKKAQERATQRKGRTEAALNGDLKKRESIKKTENSQKQAADAATKRAEKKKKAAEELIRLEQKRQKTIKAGLLDFASLTANTLGQVASLWNQHTQNNITRLNNERDKKLESLDAELQETLEREGLLEETETQKAEFRIATLQNELSKATTEEDKARIKEQIKEQQKSKKKLEILTDFKKREDAINEAAKARELALKIKAFEVEKKLNIAQTLIDTPVAAMRAFKAMAGIPIVGPALGAAAAAAATGLGMAKLAIIKSTPPPAAFEGGIVSGSQSGTLIQAGERNQSEAIIPLDNDDAQEKIGGLGGGITININIENANGDDIPEKVAVGIDQALTRLAQDKNLRLSTFI